MRFQLFESELGLTVFVANSRHRGGWEGVKPWGLAMGPVLDRCLLGKRWKNGKHTEILLTNMGIDDL